MEPPAAARTHVTRDGGPGVRWWTWAIRADADSGETGGRAPSFGIAAIDALRTAHRLGYRTAAIDMPDTLADYTDNPGIVQEQPIKE